MILSIISIIIKKDFTPYLMELSLNIERSFLIIAKLNERRSRRNMEAIGEIDRNR